MLSGVKALAKRILPGAVRRAIRQRWEDLRDWIEVFGFVLHFVATRSPRPKLLLYFGFAPGDDLISTAVLRELRKRGRGALLMVSNHRELFIGNDDPAYVRPLWPRWSMDRSTVSICRRFVRICGGEFIRPHYAPLVGDDRSRPPARHIIAELCANVGLTGPVAIRPYLTLTDDEQRQAGWARGQIAIQSSGMAARHPIRNKQWPQERYQGVVDALKEEVEFIQLGSISDPVLRHAKDLRGKTNIRETASVLYNARLYIGTVGFLMHLARAVECPGVIVFGGREAPWQSGYSCNFNLYTALSCAPCWRWNSCEFERKCMSDIAVADVVSAIRQIMERPRNPLAVDTVEIETGRIETSGSVEFLAHASETESARRSD
ncbi:MAG TPA: glycosyltransferase family 9 protein [Stellaceae bacterium]|nr:glycosyltransferase family 9 protein [Stellaceae bacterium]